MPRENNNLLGAVHISSALSHYEVARSNFFTFMIPNDTTSAASDLIENPQETIPYDSDVISLSVKQMSIPHFSNNAIEIRRGNSVVKFADSPSWNAPGNLIVQDFVGLHTKEALMAWQALVYDVNSDTLGRAGDWTVNGETFKGYKKNCILAEYTPDHQIIRSWELIGCWISNIEEQPFDVEGTGGREITARIEFDRANLKIGSTATPFDAQLTK